MKRLGLVVFVAACLPYPNRPQPTPLERHIRKQLGGEAKIKAHHEDSTYPPFTAHRKQRMDFELDAKGDVTRTEIAIPDGSVPKPVRDATHQKHIYGAKIVIENGTVTFHIDEEDQEWIVDANGKILEYSFEGDDDCDDC